jgi:anti-sigma B factor antagonist
MQASVIARESGGVSVVEVKGAMVLGEGTETLRETVRELIAGGVTKLILNLAGVSRMDSSGIGELIATRTAILNRGGQLRLLNPSRSVVGVLQVTKVLASFDVSDDESAAIASLGKGEAAAGAH